MGSPGPGEVDREPPPPSQNVDPLPIIVGVCGTGGRGECFVEDDEPTEIDVDGLRRSRSGGIELLPRVERRRGRFGATVAIVV
jgi:hypothetical protein